MFRKAALILVAAGLLSACEQRSVDRVGTGVATGVIVHLLKEAF